MTREVNSLIGDKWLILKTSGIGFRQKSDPFFEPGNSGSLLLRNLRLGVQPRKEDEDAFEITRLVILLLSLLKSSSFPIFSPTFCNVCNSEFALISEFETHYNSLHRHTCSVCKKSLPSAHLLDLHLMENHDSYFEILAAKKASFKCFLPECDSQFWTAKERLDHGVVAHKIPSNFRFTSKAGNNKTVDDNVNLTSAGGKSSNASEGGKSSNVPFSFGHNMAKTFESSYGRVLSRKKGKQVNPLEGNKMVVDLMESLPE